MSFALLLFVSTQIFHLTAWAHGPDERPIERPLRAGPACELFPHHDQRGHRGGTLSPFWAQEYIGLPYLHAALQRLGPGAITRPARIGIIDGGFNNDGVLGPRTDELRAQMRDRPFERTHRSYHGTSVANLINGGAPFGFPQGAASLAALALNEGTDAERGVQHLLSSKVDVVNISQTWDRQHGTAGMTELARRAIVVRSAGNMGPISSSYYPGAMTPRQAASEIGLAMGLAPEAALAARVANMPDTIMVGNMAWNGLPDASSQPGSNVTLLAPSSGMVRVLDGDRWLDFGGTSAATPLVSGTAAVVHAVLGEITTTEMRVLLERTAIPLL